MRIRFFSFFLIGFFLFNYLTANAQTAEYPIKKINNVTYYQYTVTTGESSFGISRKFGVSQTELCKANPGIEKGVKSGQVVLVPVPKKTAAGDSEDEKKPVNAVKSGTSYFVHKVEKNQTLYSICIKYNLTQEEVEKLYEQTKGGLKEGMVLRIPRHSEKVTQKDSVKSASNDQNSSKSAPKPDAVSHATVHDTKSTTSSIKPVQTAVKNPALKDSKKKNPTHLVEAGESFYSIAKMYNVDMQELIRLNQSKAANLEAGVEIELPATVHKKSTVATEKRDSNSNSIQSSKPFLSGNSMAKVPPIQKTIKIAFLLPFMLDQSVKDATNDKFVDFYSGALMAIEKAKQKGISFEIYTYDTEKTESKISEILTNPELKTMDLIVGPAFSNQVTQVSDFAKENRVHTLIPFTSKVAEIEDNPFLFQFNPGADTELSFSVGLFTGKYASANLIFASVPGVNSSDDGYKWAQELQNELKNRKRYFTLINLDPNGKTNFQTVLKKGVKNIIVFNTGKFTQVGPHLPNLRSYTNSYELVLFEQYHWRNQNIKLQNNIVVSPFINSPKNSEVNAFNEAFADLFGKNATVEVPRYDLLGYDLTNYFVNAIARYGERFPDKLGSFVFSEGIQSQPAFQRLSSHAGFVNQKLYQNDFK